MNYADHVPPHFHATYGDDEAQVEIASGDIVGGSLPRRAAALVKEWAELHRSELEENWRRREQSLPLNKIEPLPWPPRPRGGVQPEPPLLGGTWADYWAKKARYARSVIAKAQAGKQTRAPYAVLIASPTETSP